MLKEKKRLQSLKRIFGDSEEQKSLAQKYNSMIRITPQEFDLKKIKQLSFYVKSKL